MGEWGVGSSPILVQPGLRWNASTSKRQGTRAASRGKRAGPHRQWEAQLSLSRPCSYPSPAVAGREGVWEAG